MNYRQLQAALKEAHNNGFALTVKLNAKKEVLQAEYDRYCEYDICDIDDADLEPKELAEKRRMQAKQKSVRYHSDEELIELVAAAAINRGYTENEAQTYGAKFMDCWNKKGYTTAYYRYLERLAN